MSGPIGGAGFDLGVGLERFQADLARARQLAEEASGQINAVLSGAGPVGSSGGIAASTGPIEQLGTSARAASAQVEALAAALAAADTAATASVASARSLAVQYEAAASAALALARAQQGIGASGVAGAGLAANPAAQAQQLAAASQAVTVALATQGQALASTGVRAEQYTKGLLSAQSALNAINRELGQQQKSASSQFGLAVVDPSGRFGGAATEVQGALDAIARKDADAAVAAIARARELVDEGRVELNQAAEAARSGAVAFAGVGEEMSAEAFQAAQAAAQEAESLSVLARQATALTTVLRGLAASEQQLTAESRAAADAAEKQAIKQAEGQRVLAAQGQRADVARGVVQSDPQLAAVAGAKEALAAAGVSAKDATAAVNQLQGALASVNRALAVKDIRVGFDEATAAARALDDATRFFAAGDREAGVQAERDALEQLNAALVQGSADAAALREQLNAVNLTLEEQRAIQAQLAAITQQGTALRSAAVQTERSIASAMRETEQSTISAANATRTLGVLTQNVASAAGFSPAGQAAGGIGRGASLLQAAGITEGMIATLGLVAAVTALGLAIAGTVREGLSFDSFLDDTRVRLEAATGSAQAAQQALADIQQKAVSANYRAFATEDLAKGIELLRRMGDESEATQRRIADTAAATGQTFSATASQIATLTERLQGGLPLGNTTRELVRAGILLPEYAAKLRAAEAANASAAEKVGILNENLDRFAGTAEKAGTTSTGAFQAAKNALGELAGLALAPEFDALTKSINGLADALANDKFRQGVGLLAQLFSSSILPGSGAKAGKGVQDLFGLGPPQAAATTPPDTSATAGRAITQSNYDQAQSAYESGRAAVQQYARGFDDESVKAFADIKSEVEKGLTALGGGKLTDAMKQQFAGQIEPLLAKAVEEVQKYGAVSEDTGRKLAAILGTQSGDIRTLIDDYAGLRAAEQRAADAALALASAQGLQSYHQQVAQDIAKIDQQAIDDATKAQKADDDHFDTVIADQKKIAEGWKELGDIFHASYQQAINALDAQIATDERANQDAAQAARDQIQGLQDALSSYQGEVAQRRQEAQDALDQQRQALAGLQAQAQAAQDALSEHQAAYQAVLAGTIDLFNQEHTQQDEITRAIIAKWQAEIDGSRRAKDEADQRVRADTEREHELTLAYDKRAAAARAAGREDQARAIERERDRVLAAQRQGGQVNRDEAAVAQDRLQDRTDSANRAARDQQSSDQVAVNNAQARVKAAQAEIDLATKLEQQKQRAEDAEVKRRQAEIAQVQRVEDARARAAADDIQREKDARAALAAQQKASDEFYKSAADNINNVIIPAIEAAKKKQHDADQQRIDDAKTIKEADDAYWKARAIEDGNAVTAAGEIKKAADDTVAAYNKQIDALKTIKGLYDDINQRELAYLNGQRAILGLDPLSALPTGGETYTRTPVQGPTTGQGGGTEHGTGSQGGATPPQRPGTTTPPAPPAQPPAAPPAPQRQLPPTYDPSSAPGGVPGGYHVEYAYDGKEYYIRDGYHLEDYGVAQGAPPAQQAPPAPAPAPDPSGPGLVAGVGSLNLARASLAGIGGGGGLAAFSTGPIVPIPGYEGIGAGAGARARDIGGITGRRWDVAPAGAVNLHLFEHATVNASDPADVDRMLGQVHDAIFGTGLAAFEIAKRGGTFPGRFGGSGA